MHDAARADPLPLAGDGRVVPGPILGREILFAMGHRLMAAKLF